MDSKYINATEGRLTQGLNNVIHNAINDDYLNSRIKKIVSEARVYTGTVTKFFPHLNKSEVLLDNSRKRVICKNGLLFGTELLLLYTPTGDGGYSKKMHEKFIKPRGTLKACVVKIDNSNEYLLLTYFNQGELVGVNPAKQGNMKLLLKSGANEYYIKFGEDGLNIATNKKVDLRIRKFGDDTLHDYDKDYYTQDEVEQLVLNVLTTLDVPKEKIDLIQEKCFNTTTTTTSVTPTTNSLNENDENTS